MLRKILIVALVFIAGRSLWADTIRLNLNGSDTDTGSFSFPVYQYSDESGRLKIDDFLNPDKKMKMNLFPEGNVNLGFTPAVQWFRIRVKNSTPVDEWMMEVLYAPLDRVELFIVRDNMVQKRKLAGDQVLRKDKEVHFRHPIFPLMLPYNEYTDIYLRISSESSVQAPIRFKPIRKFYQDISDENLIYGIFYGLWIVMGLYNLLMAISLRTVSYLYYVFFIIFGSLFSASLEGLAQQYLWPDMLFWGNMSLPINLTIAAFWVLIFSNSFLRAKTYVPLGSKIIQGHAVITLTFVLIIPFVSYRLGIALSMIVAGLLFPLILPAAFIAYNRNYSPARLYIFASFAFLTGIVIRIANAVGFLPGNFFTWYSLHIGSAIEMLLITLAISDRVNMLEKENTGAKEKLLEQSKQALIKQTELSDAFHRFVPEQFLKYMNHNDVTSVKLGDAVRAEMTMLFSDIRAFTTQTEKMNAEESFKFLNSYLSVNGPIIKEFNGFIDKYIGDAILALFPHSASDAVYTAVEFKRKLRVYNRLRTDKYNDPLRIGIGIHTGDVMLGTIGSHERMETTVIGDAVNLTARLEAMTKRYGLAVILSDHVVKRLNGKAADYHMREIDSIRVRGKENPTVLYELYEEDPDEIIELKNRYLGEWHEALIHYKMGNFEISREIFFNYLNNCPGDILAETYIRRCNRLIKDPPGETWDGVFNMD